MELQLPEEIRLEPETINLLESLEETKAELDEQRPFSAEVEKKISTTFLPDRVTATLNIEGISVNRRQTLSMMDAMTLRENSSKAEHELLNALKADEYIYDCSVDDVRLSEGLIRETNALLLDGTESTAGGYREIQVEIAGAAFIPPAPCDISPLLSDLVKVYNRSTPVAAVLRAVWLHGQFTQIHPFVDGNGRTGRLLQDYSLMCSGFYPTGIPSSQRDDYYDALEEADDGRWDAVCQMVANAELEVLGKIKTILAMESERENFVARLVKAGKDTREGTLHKQYLVWKQRMDQFADSFVEMCDSINSASEEIAIYVQRFPTMNFSKWQEVAKKGAANQTWLIKADWHYDGQVFFRTIFFFRRHHIKPYDVFPSDDLYGKVALQITGGTLDDPRFDFSGRFHDEAVRFREVMWVNDSLCSLSYLGEKREGKYGDVEEIWETNSETNIPELVNGIFTDILQRKLGLDF